MPRWSPFSTRNRATHDAGAPGLYAAGRSIDRRTLSSQKVLTAVPVGTDRSIAYHAPSADPPGAKVAAGVPLRHRNRTYGFLVIGRKTMRSMQKDKTMLEQTGDDITKALERDSLSI